MLIWSFASTATFPPGGQGSQSISTQQGANCRDGEYRNGEFCCLNCPAGKANARSTVLVHLHRRCVSRKEKVLDLSTIGFVDALATGPIDFDAQLNSDCSVLVSGTYLKSACTASGEKGQCEKCADETYTQYANDLKDCFPCTKCSPGISAW